MCVACENFFSSPPQIRAWSVRRGQPLACHFFLSRIEVFDGRHRERLADRGHPLFPSILAHHGDFIDVEAMLGRELGVFPNGTQIPAVEVMHNEQNLDLAGRPNQSRNCRLEVLVVFFGQLAARFDFKQFCFCAFNQFNRHRFPADLLSYMIRYDGVFTPDSFREKFQHDSVEKEIAKKEKKRLILLFGVPRSDDYAQLSQALKDEQADGMLVPEIRPQLRGTQEVARELIQRGIPTTLISDNMMGTFFAQEEIRRVYLFYHELDENGPVGICGSLLTARLAQVHGVPINLLGSGENRQQPLDETVATFMGQRVCSEEVVTYPIEKERIPWSLLKNKR